MPLRAIFGTNLRDRRKSLGMSRDALSAIVGCDPITIRNYEKSIRWPEPEMADKLATALGLDSTGELYQDPQFPPSNDRILLAVRNALMERDMLRNLQSQGRLPKAGTPEWNEMLRAGFKNRAKLVSEADELITETERALEGLTPEKPEKKTHAKRRREV